MYNDLIKALRETDFSDGCPCEAEPMCQNEDCIIAQAADAREELSRKYIEERNAAVELTGELAKMPRWIPVTERLPIGGDDSGAVCENVCLFMDDGPVSCGWMNGITKKVYYLNARDDFVIKAPITRVTHWMPLPKPPKEE